MSVEVSQAESAHLNQAKLDEIVALAQTLPLAERLQLIERIAATASTTPQPSQAGDEEVESAKEPRQNVLAGSLSHLGPAPSMEDFEEARREAWKFSDEELLSKPLRLRYGMLAELGPGPSEEDIAEVRREMLANFPREDIA